LHAMPPYGAILGMPLKQALALGLKARLSDQALQEHAMQGLSGNARALALAWNRVFAQPMKETEPLIGGPLMGDAMDFKAKPALATGQTQIQAQGLWASTPPKGSEYCPSIEYLAGRVAVGVFLVQANGEIDPVKSTWSAAREADVTAEITAAMDWLRTQTGAPVEFVYEWKYKAPCGYEPITRPGGACQTWIGDVLVRQGFQGVDVNHTNCLYNRDLRQRMDADWVFNIFVVDDTGVPSAQGRFTDAQYAFAKLGGPFQVMTYSLAVVGNAGMDFICAHETGHMFNALDEYSLTAPASSTSGYFNWPNTNSADGGTLNDPLCVMRATSVQSGMHICPATLMHMGIHDSDGDGIIDVADTQPKSQWGPGNPQGGQIGQSFTLQGRSSDQALGNLSPGLSVTLNSIVKVLWRLNGGPWQEAVFEDGLGHSADEDFHFSTGPLLGTSLVEVAAVNSAGNTESAYLSATLRIGTPTATPTSSITATATRTFSPGPSPSFTSTPVVLAPGECLSIPSIAESYPSMYRAGVLFLGGEMYSAYVSPNGSRRQLELKHLSGGAWLDVAGSPVDLGTGGAMPMAMEDGGRLRLFALSNACPTCTDPSASALVSWTYSPSSGLAYEGVASQSVLVSGGGQAYGIMLHQGVPFVALRALNGRSDYRILKWDGSAWIQANSFNNHSFETNFAAVLVGDRVCLFSTLYGDDSRLIIRTTQIGVWDWDIWVHALAVPVTANSLDLVARGQEAVAAYLGTDNVNHALFIDPSSHAVTERSQGLSATVPLFGVPHLLHEDNALFMSINNTNFGNIRSVVYSYASGEWRLQGCNQLYQGDASDSIRYHQGLLYRAYGSINFSACVPEVCTFGTATSTVSFTRSPTVSLSPTVSPTFTESATVNGTFTDTPSPTFTHTPSPSPSQTATPTMTPSASDTPSWTASPSADMTDSPSPSKTPSQTQSATFTHSSTPSVTATGLESATPSLTGTMSSTATPTILDTPLASPSPQIEKGVPEISRVLVLPNPVKRGSAQVAITLSKGWATRLRLAAYTTAYVRVDEQALDIGPGMGKGTRVFKISTRNWPKGPLYLLAYAEDNGAATRQLGKAYVAE
jgi:hypothetical protein